jgi:predicted nucleic acid-binding protein
MSLPGYFLDTNVLVTAFLIEESDGRRLLELGRRGKARLLTSDYVLRELRFALVRKFRVPAGIVESFILDEIAPSLLILRKPSRQEVRGFRLKISDRSDIPILIPCVKHGLTLVTLDSKVVKSAREFIKVVSPREGIRAILRSTT